MVEVLINEEPYCPFLENEPIVVDSWQVSKNGFLIAGCFEIDTHCIDPTILQLINKERNV